MEPIHKRLNKQQTELRRTLEGKNHSAAIQFFLHQHACLHSSQAAPEEECSHEDLILNGLSPEQFRCIPSGFDHSIIWCLWHIARIEDVAMNILVSNSPQILHQNDWLNRLNVSFVGTGNAMTYKDLEKLNASIHIEALRAYRAAVGQRTRAIVRQLTPDDLNQEVDPQRLQRVVEERAVAEAAKGVLEYWSRRTTAGLLLMPATRHNLVHLNECARIKYKLEKSSNTS